jgi:hypothetical protein
MKKFFGKKISSIVLSIAVAATFVTAPIFASSSGGNSISFGGVTSTYYWSTGDYNRTGTAGFSRIGSGLAPELTLYSGGRVIKDTTASQVGGSNLSSDAYVIYSLYNSKDGTSRTWRQWFQW